MALLYPLARRGGLAASRADGLVSARKPRSSDSGFPRWPMRAGALPRSGWQPL